MKLKSLVGLFASAALCVSLFGCAGSSQDESTSNQSETVSIDASTIEVVQAGFSMGDDGAVNYAFTVSNPNDGYLADSVTFSISGYDADGNMVMGGAESIERMYPGIEYAAAGTSYLAGSATMDRIEITPSMDLVGWIPTDISPNDAASMFSVVDSRAGRLGDGSVSVNGRVVADNIDTIASAEGVSADAISARVCAILVDTDGNFLAGGHVDGLVFDEEEGVVHESENLGSDASSNEQAQAESASGEVLKAAQFSISILGSPGFKECRYFVMPS